MQADGRSDRQTDRQTDRHNETNSHFSQFTKAPKTNNILNYI